MSQRSVKRRGPGRPRLRPKRLVADKGCRSHRFRCYLRRRGIRSTNPRKSNKHSGGSFDKAVYRERNRVERLFNRLKQHPCIAMLTLVAILPWL